MSRLILINDGFEIVCGENERARVRWNDVKEIFAFKLDLVMHDTVRIGFRADDSGEHYEVDEDWPGFEALIAEVQRRFDIADGWRSAIVHPAFATNRTTLWREPT